MTGVRFLHMGHPQHAVSRYALGHADALAAAGVVVEHLWPSPGGEIMPLAEGPITHVHFTDRLWPLSRTVPRLRMVDVLTQVPRPIVVSLHDLPDPALAPPIGVSLYKAVASRADHVVVGSDLALRRARVLGIRGPISLVHDAVLHDPFAVGAVLRLPRATATDDDALVLGVLGGVRRGKAIAEVVTAAGILQTESVRRRVDVRVIGAVGEDEAVMLRGLTGLAEDLGVNFAVEGSLSHGDRRQSMAEVDVPIVPAVDPIGSMAVFEWIGAGFRPLVRWSPWAMEVAEDISDHVRLYWPEDLAHQIESVLGSAPPRPGTLPPHRTAETVAERFIRLYDNVRADADAWQADV